MIFQFKVSALCLLFALSCVNQTSTTVRSPEYLLSHYLPEETLPNNDLLQAVDENKSVRKKIHLAGTWQARNLYSEQTASIKVPGVFTFQGSVIFEREFFLSEELSKNHIKFVAEGINYRSSIFINEKFLGTHYGGFTRFTYDIEAELLKFGENNKIRILTDNWLDSRLTIPPKHRPFSEINYGGIHRDIYLLALPQLMIDDYTYELVPDTDSTKSKLALQINLRNLLNSEQASSLLKTKNELIVKLWSPPPKRKLIQQKKIKIQLNSNILQIQKLVLDLINPQFWSPKLPALYEIELSLQQGRQTTDYLKQQIGLRRVSIQGNRIFCNNSPYLIKGIEWHPDRTPAGFASRSKYLAQIVATIKSLGMNSVRIVGFPPDPCFIQLCNENGLFVFEELPLQNIPKERFQEASWRELAEMQFSEMIIRDRNQPSVIAWGIGAGLTTSRPAVAQYLDDMKNFISDLDFRPAYTVLSAFKFIPECPVSDLCFINIFDLTRIDLNSVIAATQRRLSTKPLFFSVGFPFSQGEAATVSSTKKESRQSYYLGLAAQKILASSQASGVFINSLKDWRLSHPTSLFGKEQPLNIAPYGLISLNGEKRLAFHHLAALFSEDKTTPLTAIHIPEESTNFFTIVGVALLFLFIYFYKRDRRIRVDISRSIQRPHGFISDIRENRKISIFETISLSLFITTLLALISTILVFHYKDNFFFDQILNLLLISPSLKTNAIHLIWQPEYCLLVFFAFYYSLFLIGAFLFKLFGKIFGKKVSLTKAFSYVFWTNSIVLFLLPAGPVLFKLLNFSPAKPFIFGLIGLLQIFIFFKTIRGLAVLYFEKNSHVMSVVLIILVVVVLSLGVYYQKNNALFDYLSFYLEQLP